MAKPPALWATTPLERTPRSQVSSCWNLCLPAKHASLHIGFELQERSLPLPLPGWNLELVSDSLLQGRKKGLDGGSSPSWIQLLPPQDLHGEVLRCGLCEKCPLEGHSAFPREALKLFQRTAKLPAAPLGHCRGEKGPVRIRLATTAPPPTWCVKAGGTGPGLTLPGQALGETRWRGSMAGERGRLTCTGTTVQCA